MKNPNRSSIVLGLVAGTGLTVVAAAMMGQGAARSGPADTQYFVTANDGEAHLWLREGNTLKMVAHGECAECEAKGHDGHGHKEGDGHDHAKPAAGAGKAGGDHGDHGHGEGDALGTVTIGAWTVNVSGEVKAGSEAHLDIKLSGSAARPAAVRVWIGTQDGRGAMKQKADGDGKEYHAHTDVPNPIPADAKLWIEIDDGKGGKTVGGFAIKR
ncbi:MAG: hypothetical protein KF787_08935 [Phycisphaeraceae bacterium]|nr:hypothetical protein [Phycisphaeraceae bacterium]